MKKIKSQWRKSLQKLKIQRRTKWEILKLQNIINQMKTQYGISREQRVSELKGRTIEMNQSEEYRENRPERKKGTKCWGHVMLWQKISKLCWWIPEEEKEGGWKRFKYDKRLNPQTQAQWTHRIKPTKSMLKYVTIKPLNLKIEKILKAARI